jgi:hypothetical protein
VDNLIIIKNGNIHFPKAYFRGNGSMVHFSPTNFITPKGILFPLDFYSFGLNEYLTGGMTAIKTMDIPLRGVLLGPGRTIYEITVKSCTGDDLDIESMTPMQYEPDVVYARGSEPILDVIGSVGLQEDCDPVDILIAASKLTNLNRHHYSIMPIMGYFKVLEKMLAMREKN